MAILIKQTPVDYSKSFSKRQILSTEISYYLCAMSNNDILRSLRYTFDFNDQQMIDLFALGGKTVDRPQVSNWLKRDEDEEFEGIYDIDLAAFLNGLIIEKRGVKEDGKPLKAEKTLSNNLVLRKLKNSDFCI